MLPGFIPRNRLKSSLSHAFERPMTKPGRRRGKTLKIKDLWNFMVRRHKSGNIAGWVR
jgi:hypothetical protein